MSVELSIVMPVHNEEEYLETAVDSVLAQEVDASYEIIFVDDASTDRTPEIIAKYKALHPDKIKSFRNETNKGEGYATWHGIAQTSGDYMHVLDGDDYFLTKDKLQRQLDFLREHKEFSAVATNCLQLFNDGSSKPMAESGQGDKEYTYEDVLRCQVYFHTSNYLFRNAYRGKVTEEMKNAEWIVGDTPRTFLHVKYGPIKYLDIITSVYRYHEKGIWSSLTEEKKKETIIRVFSLFRDHAMDGEDEKRILTETIDAIINPPPPPPAPPKRFSKEYFQKKINHYCSIFKLS